MFEKELPEWLAKGVKPAPEIIENGYQAGYKPPAEWMNWWMNRSYEAMQEMRTQLENSSPSGMIVMWSGTYANIPTGWYLCDGNNGTPDLRDRFVLGATTESEIGETGGKHEVTLTESEMPSHGHSGSTSTSGSHTHRTGIVIVDHNNTVEAYADEGTSGTRSGGYAANGTSDSVGSFVRARTNNTGTHSHSLNINSTGGGQPHENRPAFYKLAFIMKV